ncbi:MAG TPA: guanylate kinase [bacterium]|nr:guanylate kinase [bacterium]
MPMQRGRLFVISAPSGAGKSTVVSLLRSRFPGLAFSVSCTTRPRRNGEKDGVHYRFIERKNFERMAAEGEFAEWAEVHGELYGTPIGPLEEMLSKGQDVLLDVDVQGGMAIKNSFPDAKTIFLVPPSMEELERRLVGRKTDSPKQIELRLENARIEMGFKKSYDITVVNDDVDRAVDELSGIVSR